MRIAYTKHCSRRRYCFPWTSNKSCTIADVCPLRGMQVRCNVARKKNSLARGAGCAIIARVAVVWRAAFFSGPPCTVRFRSVAHGRDLCGALWHRARAWQTCTFLSPPVFLFQSFATTIHAHSSLWRRYKSRFVWEAAIGSRDFFRWTKIADHVRRKNKPLRAVQSRNSTVL